MNSIKNNNYLFKQPEKTIPSPTEWATPDFSNI